MLRRFAFFIIAPCYLLFLDCEMVFLRIFRRKRLEAFINQNVRTWANTLINLSKILLDLQYRNETTRSMRSQMPPHFVVISNHQSYLDICFAYHTFWDHQIRFVAKRSLGKGFPGVAQTLRYQRHALIDQSGNPRTNFEIIARYARRCMAKGYSPLIFPEGTRSRTGELKPFQPAGVRMITDQCPLPIVVLAMDGAWKLATLKDYLSPEPKRVRAKVIGILPSPRSKEETKEVLTRAQELIAAQLDSWRGTGAT